MEIKIINIHDVRDYIDVVYNDVKESDTKDIWMSYSGKDIKAIIEHFYKIEQENHQLKEELRIIKEHPIISKFYKEPTGIKCYMGGRGYGKTNYQLQQENHQLKDKLDQIHQEISTWCESAKCKEHCHEQECLLYRIEQIIVTK